MIYLVCREEIYKFFRDYCDGLIKKGGMKLIKFKNNMSVIPINDTDLFIFCQLIPDQFFKNSDKYHICLLNTEQLTIPSWLALDRKPRCMLKVLNSILDSRIPVIDYDRYQTRLTSSEIHYHIPYQIYPEENDHLTNLVKTLPKIHDVGICCLATSKRRHDIFNRLKANGVDIINTKGWKDTRDRQIAQCKILINIHMTDDHRIFEHLRCDRWVFAGQIVVTEVSDSDAYLDHKDLMHFSTYDKLVDKIKEVLADYDKNVEELQNKLIEYGPAIIENREKKFKEVIDLLSNA